MENKIPAQIELGCKSHHRHHIQIMRLFTVSCATIVVTRPQLESIRKQQMALLQPGRKA
jgi:hypothetical protein